MFIQGARFIQQIPQLHTVYLRRNEIEQIKAMRCHAWSGGYFRCAFPENYSRTVDEEVYLIIEKLRNFVALSRCRAVLKVLIIAKLFVRR